MVKDKLTKKDLYLFGLFFFALIVSPILGISILLKYDINNFPYVFSLTTDLFELIMGSILLISWIGLLSLFIYYTEIYHSIGYYISHWLAPVCCFIFFCFFTWKWFITTEIFYAVLGVMSMIIMGKIVVSDRVGMI